MKRNSITIIAFLFCLLTTALGQNFATKSSNYLFVWAGDADRKESDFLAVIDVRPSSKRYGKIVTTLPVGASNTVPHHTEHEMPAGGILFANGFNAGQTFRFDLSIPTKPQLLDSFGAAGEFMHPHSFVRHPNGNALATFQMRGHHNEEPGALVELDPKGKVLRVADAADPKVEKFIRPYSLAVVPALDRVVTTSSDMHEKDISHVVQIWRYSDFKLLKTVWLPPGKKEKDGIDPAEPRVLADGRTCLFRLLTAVYIRLETLSRQSLRQNLFTLLATEIVPCLSSQEIFGFKRWEKTAHSSASMYRIRQNLSKSAG